MDEIIQNTEPQMPQPQKVNPKTRKKFYTILGIAIFAVVATAGTIMSFAYTPSNGSYYGTYWSTIRMQEDFWNGKINTNKDTCISKQLVCHQNGKLIFQSANNNVWQSDPAKNQATGFSSATWMGPYIYASGVDYNSPYYGYTGQAIACFRIRDITAGSGSAKIALVIRNAANFNPTQPAKNLKIVEGTLGTLYKKGMNDLCVRYYNQVSHWSQSYTVYVRSGTVRLDYVDRFEEYYSYYDDYNPYYGYYGGLKSANKLPSSTNVSLCNTAITKSTTSCKSTTDFNKFDVSKTLTGYKVVSNASPVGN